MSEGASDRMSLPPDDCSLKDVEAVKNTRPAPQLEILPPPPNNNPKKISLSLAETYSSPQSDVLTVVSTGSGTSSLPPAGAALSAHHELQLMREQLEQQSQQTHAALAQLQLTKEQLAAEQSARLEAQARTHQLLVHNRELLDHIAALVAHLQGEKPGQQQTPPHMTMPQQQPHQAIGENYLPDISESAHANNTPLSQPFGMHPQGLIENRGVTSCLPPSPLRSTFNPSGSVFNFTYPEIASFESQLLQRLQASSGYPPASYQYLYSQSLPFLSSNLYNQPLLNNNYTLQPPPLKKISPSSLLLRNSYCGSTETDQPLGSTRNSEPRQLPNFNQYQHNPTLQFNANQNGAPPSQYQPPTQNQPQPNQFQYQEHMKADPKNTRQNYGQQNHQRLQVQQRQAKESSPVHHPSSNNDQKGTNFIKPLAQVGTLTTTDSEGRVRVIVPVPSDSREDISDVFTNLRLTDTLKPMNGPGITRTTSEKVPNRSELMSQVQRTAWARHTTK